MRCIFGSLKDGAKREDYFEVEIPVYESKAPVLNIIEKPKAPELEPKKIENKKPENKALELELNGGK